MKINPVIKEIIEWGLCLLVATLIALVIKYYIGTPTKVEGSSMEPTLYDEQRLWVNRWGRTIGKLPERGDIVIIEAPTQTRIIDRENVEQSNPVAQYKNSSRISEQVFLLCIGSRKNKLYKKGYSFTRRTCTNKK